MLNAGVYKGSLQAIAGGSPADLLLNADGGNVLVGTTDGFVWDNSAGTSADNGLNLRADGRLGVSYYTATAGSNASANINRTGSDGDIVRLHKDGTTVGSIGSNSGTRLSIGSADTGLLFVQDADDIIPFNTSTGAGRDNAIDLGQSGNRFKDLYLSGGVYLGGTGSANKLDDYEEGTWSGSLNEGANSLVNTGGYYTKVGNTVTVHWGVNFTVTNANNGLLTMSGLPFTPIAAGVGSVIGRLLGTGVSNVVVMAVANSGSLRFRQYTSTGYMDNVYNNELLATNGAGSDYMWLSCTYQTNS